MTKSRKKRRSLTRRLGQLESLEERIALDGEGLEAEELIWGDAPYLTLSFAEDGTDVDGQPNKLFEIMNAIPDGDDWQNTILSAFETWATQTNGDVGDVSDDGSAFGTNGDTQGDPRFGDIRVGAIPLRADAFAVAVSRGFIAGTWSGDVFFNSEIELANLDEVFRIALHEAGHVFGLDDNDDPTSVMFDTGIPTITEPSAADLAQLWANFGERIPDINEREQSNDTQGTATQIPHSEEEPGEDAWDGTTPLIVHADIGENVDVMSDVDVDVYRFDPPPKLIPTMPGETEPVTIQIRTQGLSQLDPQVAIFDKDGNELILKPVIENGKLTVTFELTYNNDDPDNGRHFIHVQAADNAESPIGSYALVATMPNPLVTSPEAIDLYAGPNFRFMEQEDLQEIFEGDPEGMINFFGDDMHQNDTIATATELEEQPGFEEGAKYSAVASISDDTDIDFYEIKSLELIDGIVTPDVISILVDSLFEDPLDAKVELLGPSGSVLAHKNLLHHGGRTLIQLTGLEPDTEHYVRVVAADPTDMMHNTGNYRLTVIAGSIETVPESIASANNAANHMEFEYVASRPELVTFSFEGSTNLADAQVDVTLVNVHGQVVHSFSGRTNEFFTADGLMLDRGTYFVHVDHDGAGGDMVDFELFAAVITDPLAVPLGDTTTTPIFEITNFDESFVFPGGDGAGSGLVLPPLHSSSIEGSADEQLPRRTPNAGTWDMAVAQIFSRKH